MKAIKSPAIVAALAFLNSFLMIGCYTQLLITDDEPSASDEPQTTEIVQPPPTVIVVEPVYVLPITPPYQPAPVVRPASPGTGTQSPSPAPVRDIGNYRTAPSNSGNPSTGASNRGGGSKRGGG